MPDDKLADTIAEGRALLVDATPRPWEQDGTEVYQKDAYVDGTGARVWVAHTSLEDDVRGEADGALIVWMRNNIKPLLDHVETLESGGRFLADTIKQYNQMALDATGLHHIIDENGDGDWAAVWENLCELGATNEALKARHQDELARTLVKRQRDRDEIAALRNDLDAKNSDFEAAMAKLCDAERRVAELEEDNAHLLNAQRDAQLNGGAQ